MKYLIGLFLFLLMISCGSNKHIQKSTVISDEDQRAFYYAFTEATKQELFGNYASAEKLYKECLKVDNGSAAAYYQLSRISLFKGDAKAAIDLARIAENIDTANIWYAMHLARIFQMNNMSDSVVAVYERVVRRHNTDFDAAMTLANLYVYAKENEKAIKLCYKIENQFGNNEELSIIKLNAFRELKKYKEAIEELKYQMVLDTENINFIIQMAEFNSLLNDTLNAKNYYSKAYSKDSTNVNFIISYSRFLENIGDTKESFLVMTKLFEAQNLDEEKKTQLFYTLFNDSVILREHKDKLLVISDTLAARISNKSIDAVLADFYLRVDSLNKAAHFVKRLLVKDSANYFLWEQLVYIYSHSENKDSLYEITKRGVVAFPDKPQMLYFHALAASQKDSIKVAIDVLLKALTLDFKNSKDVLQNIYSFLGENYYKYGEYKLAFKYYDEALSLNPNDFIILNNYSYFLSVQEQDLEKAEQMSRQTVKKFPDNPTYLDTYGWIMFKMGKIKEAKKYVELALKYGGEESAEIFDHYGDILLELRDIDGAIRNWEKSLEIEPGNDQLIKKLRKYKGL